MLIFRSRVYNVLYGSERQQSPERPVASAAAAIPAEAISLTEGPQSGAVRIGAVRRLRFQWQPETRYAVRDLLSVPLP